MENETYLGDAVYASFDGYHIWLRTDDLRQHRIALEPSVYAALVRYRDSLYANPKRRCHCRQHWWDDELEYVQGADGRKHYADHCEESE